MVNTITSSSRCAKSNGRLCIGLFIALILLYYSFLNNLDTIPSLFLTIISSIISLVYICHYKLKLVYVNSIKFNLLNELTTSITRLFNEFICKFKLNQLFTYNSNNNIKNNKNSDNNFSMKFVNKNVIVDLLEFYNKLLYNNVVDDSYRRSTAINEHYSRVTNIKQYQFKYFNKRLVINLPKFTYNLINNL